ncbi:MAG: hypothetical protein WCL60_16865 [Methylococcales bacterium]
MDDQAHQKGLRCRKKLHSAMTLSKACLRLSDGLGSDDVISDWPLCWTLMLTNPCSLNCFII